MGAVSNQIDTAFRDYQTDGVPSSGTHEPVKSEIRAIGPLIETALGNIGIGAMLSVSYATKAELDGDLAHDADSVALVYDDATDANNDFYVKTGASGAGSWTRTDVLHTIIDSLAASSDYTLTAKTIEFIDDAAVVDTETTGDLIYPVAEYTDSDTGKTIFALMQNGQSWFGDMTDDTIGMIATRMQELNVGVTWRDETGETAIDIAATTDLQRATITDAEGWTGRVVQPRTGSFATSLPDNAVYGVGIHDYGQSNAGGGGNYAPDFTDVLYPHHSLIFTAGRASVGNGTAITASTLNDFRGAWNAGLQTYAGVLHAFAEEALDRRFGLPDAAYLTRTDWNGGQPIDTFLQGTTDYTNLIASVTKAKEVFAKYGKAYTPYIIFTQGETNSDDRATYASKLTTLIGDLQTDIKAITNTVPQFMFWQINAGDESTASYTKPSKLAQLDVAKAFLGSSASMIGPMYQFPIMDDIHSSEEGRMMQGELRAIVRREITRKGHFTPLMPKSVSRDGAVIVIDFYNPGLPIRFDDDWIAAAVTTDDYGFTYFDDGTPPAISSVEITGDAQVTITLASTPTGSNKVIRYAIDEQDTTDDGWSSGRGLLYSSSGVASPFYEKGQAVPADIRHYAVCFEESLS